ncbi:hypothetical protein TNCV_2069701 [Trichonephila clavipes]|uniref:Uncharacterized protein n=1 Tax=Trichonephila clavipes TaxID=2585209 RepID=A0A8X6W305_TRICX|nr:hypothetical protein TNCV_2069701 [Trichonephila clavipes]
MRNIKRIIYSKLQINRSSRYGDASAGKRWNILLNKSGIAPTSQARSVGVACFRLLTGYDYLHYIGFRDSGCCPLCHQGEIDGDHNRHHPIVLKFFVDNSTEANELNGAENQSPKPHSLFSQCLLAEAGSAIEYPGSFPPNLGWIRRWWIIAGNMQLGRCHFDSPLLSFRLSFNSLSLQDIGGNPSWRKMLSMDLIGCCCTRP